MKRLTDRRTAEAVRENIEGLQSKGFEVSVNDLIYVKLAEYENAEEDKDVQPVKRGRWENTNTPNQLRCSKCEVIHFIAQYPHGEINYCPNCGARMEQEGDME